jgi:prepilin-type N-terminal cleavage/methylation domain-containing protein
MSESHPAPGPSRRARGFSLVEISVVLAILPLIGFSLW